MAELPDHPIISNMERTGYPSGKEPIAVFVCSGCGEDICEGEAYWECCCGEQFCEACNRLSQKVAELVEPEGERWH